MTDRAENNREAARHLRLAAMYMKHAGHAQRRVDCILGYADKLDPEPERPSGESKDNIIQFRPWRG